MKNLAIAATAGILALASSTPPAAAEKAAPAKPGAADAAAAPADKAANTTDDSYVLYKLAPANSIFGFDYGPPTSPALNLLGLTTDNTTTSTSLKKFVLAAPSVFSKDADKSVAFDFALGALFEPPNNSSFNNYLKPGLDGYLYRLGQRTRVNLAARNGDDNSDPTKAVHSGVALGLTASLLDSGDPLAAGRDASGHPYMQHCFERFTPIVTPILAMTATSSVAQLQAQKAIHDLERAAAALRAHDPKDPLYAQDLKAAHKLADPYLPGGVAPADQPVATAPAQPKPAGALQKIQTLAANPELVTRLGGDLAKQLTDALNQLAAENGGAPPGKDPGPAADGGGAANGAAAGVADGDLAKAITDNLASWNDKLTKLNQQDASDIVTKTDAQIKAQLHYTGAADAFSACSTQASALAHYGADIDVGVGQLWNGKPGALQDLEPKGDVLWAAFRIPIGVKFLDFTALDKNSAPISDTLPKQALMLVGSARYGMHERVETGDKTTPEIVADTSNAWLGLEYLRSGIRAVAQYGWVKTDAKLASLDKFSHSGERYQLLTQWRLGDETSGTWVGVTYGNGYGDSSSLKATTAMVTISYSPPKPPDITAGK